MQHYLKIIGNGQHTARDLTPAEADAAFTLIMEGAASLPQVAVFMAALRIKEESTQELASFAGILRRYCQTVQVDSPYLVDICVPYDGRSRRTSLIPLAALIAASAGASIALHGRLGQHTPPKFGVGIGDILAAMGLPVDQSLDAAAELLRDESIGVAYADVTTFAPALERFNGVRFDYGMRSFFNTVEKILNPFTAPNGIVGVFHGPVLERAADAMRTQGYRRGLAVQGSEGAIDILTSRRTPLVEFGRNEDSTLQSWRIDPDDFGWWEQDGDATDRETEVTAVDNAALIWQLIEQPDNPALRSPRRTALLTAGLILYMSGKESTFAAGLAAAQVAFASGEIAARLKRWRTHAQREDHRPQDTLEVEVGHGR